MEGNIYITGLIGTIYDNEGIVTEKGVELIDVITQVKAQKGATSFNVFINSPGGVVDTGFDIYNYLKSLQIPINTIGQGMVASIATVIYMAGMNRSLKPNTEFMIHLPSGEVGGTSDDIQLYLDYIKDTQKRIIKFYADNTGLNEEALLPLLKNETFLSVQQAYELGFSNTQPIAVAPIAYFNLKTDDMKLSDDDKSWIEKQFGAILNTFKSKAKMLLVQDANGVEIDFTDLEEGQDIVVDLKATVDGAPAEGDFVMPSGETYVFSGGTLTEIKPVEGDDTTALQEEIAQLKEQLAAQTTAKLDAENETVAQKAIVAKFEKEVKDFKAQITSKFDLDGKKENEGEKVLTQRTFLKV